MNAVLGDLYLHMPRGSNNRLNENSGPRRNNNRLYDSQNNNNGGYNVGDATKDPAQNMAEQHKEIYFQSGTVGKSYLTVEWTNQHGCGAKDPDDTNAIDCHMILQYKCDSTTNINDNDQPMRNGFSTDTPQYSKSQDIIEENFAQKKDRYRKDHDENAKNGRERGLQESWENYDSCNIRKRNNNLFLADQKLKGYESIYTRQNPNGQRRGFECPEERDYFPYWHPTEWTDIAVLTSQTDKCQFYKDNSSNRAPKGECIEKYNGGDPNDTPIYKHASRWNNEKDCMKKNDQNQWIEFYDYLKILEDLTDETSCLSFSSNLINGEDIIWDYPRRIGFDRHDEPKKKCLLLHPEIDCQEAIWSRANHLGNTLNGDHAQYRWELPNFMEPDDPKECVFRMRYNISSNDYPEIQLDGTDLSNYFDHQYLQNDPNIAIYKATDPEDDINLALAINTAQIARTFQDRSHNFILMPREMHQIPNDFDIENIQVRGKRGNIVQTFPAVEYDFQPQNPIVTTNSMIHFQWTGSNTNPGGNAGEGKAGSDRNNIVTVDAINWNIPQGKLQIDDFQEILMAQDGRHFLVFKDPIVRGLNKLRSFCDERNMEIPVPKSQIENDALAMLDIQYFLLGITDIDVEGEFRNIYTGKEVEFKNFAPGMPDNYTNKQRPGFENGEQLVEMWHERGRGKWNDIGYTYAETRGNRAKSVCWREIQQSELDTYLADLKIQPKSMWDNAEWIWTSSNDKDVMTSDMATKNLEIQMATSGFYECIEDCEKSVHSKPKLQNQLNNAPASYHGNMVMFHSEETHHFISTRNNNFSNRAQKSNIKIVNPTN